MKRNIFFVAILIITLFLCSCSNKEISNTSNQEKSNIIVVSNSTDLSTYQSGTHFLFETNQKNEYLNFLNSLDYDKFEIIGVIATKYAYAYTEHEIYTVTYKIK